MMAYGQVNADVIGTSVAGSNLGAGNASLIKSRIINGAMVIDQRNAGASLTAVSGSSYSLDRWNLFASQASKFTVQQNAGSVTPPVGFANYLGVTSSSAYTVGSSELFVVGQAVEGFNIADLGWGTANAKTITISFQVYSSLTGTFGGSLRNSATTRSYPFSYTVSTANTWTSVSITIAGDTSGTWLTTNGVGIYVYFSLGTGSTLNATAGAWIAGSYLSATGATSVVGTSGATFYITGVQLEVGSSATGFEYRQYQQELALCQRYYQRFNCGAYNFTYFGGSYAFNTTTCTVQIPTYVPFRATPTTLDASSPSLFQLENAATDINVSALALNTSIGSQNTAMISCSATGLTAGTFYGLLAKSTTAAYVGLGAEL